MSCEQSLMLFAMRRKCRGSCSMQCGGTSGRLGSSTQDGYVDGVVPMIDPLDRCKDADSSGRRRPCDVVGARLWWHGK